MTMAIVTLIGGLRGIEEKTRGGFDIGRLEDSRDQRHPMCTCAAHLLHAGKRDPTDGKDREVTLPTGFFKRAQPNRIPIRTFRRRVIHGTKDGEIRSLSLSLQHFGDVMDRRPDQTMRAEHTTCSPDRHAIGSKMDPVRAKGKYQIDTIVDEE